MPERRFFPPFFICFADRIQSLRRVKKKNPRFNEYKDISHSTAPNNSNNGNNEAGQDAGFAFLSGAGVATVTALSAKASANIGPRPRLSLIARRGLSRRVSRRCFGVDDEGLSVRPSVRSLTICEARPGRHLTLLHPPPSCLICSFFCVCVTFSLLANTARRGD